MVGLGKKHHYKIIGYARSGGQKVVYEGSDYSCVSDAMLNENEDDATYASMELYTDGTLTERATASLPQSKKGRK